MVSDLILIFRPFADSCCCNHGGRCTCSHKKEPSLDTVPESDSEAEVEVLLQSTTKPRATTRRRRTNTTHSEPILSFDENGHHKPAQRHTKASQKSGPYSVTRASNNNNNNSSSSASSASMHRTTSASSLGTKSSSVGRSRAGSSSSPDRHAARLTKSAQASPSIESTSSSSSSSSSFQQLNGQLPPLDLSAIRYPDYASTSSSSFDLFSGISDYEPPMFSAGLSAASVDWAQYDGLELKGADGLTPSSFDQTQSYMGLDFGGSGSGSGAGASGSATEPTLTSNSGDVSETEDFMSAFSGEPQFDTTAGFRGAGSYLGMSASSSCAAAAAAAAQHQHPGAADLNNLDFDQFKGTAAASKLLATQHASASFADDSSSSVFPSLVDEDSYWGMNNFTDGITHSPDPLVSGMWDTA